MTEYVVVEHGSIARLGRDVEKLMGEGWTCQGGVAVFWNAGGWIYLQAMVK